MQEEGGSEQHVLVRVIGAVSQFQQFCPADLSARIEARHLGLLQEGESQHTLMPGIAKRTPHP